MRELRPGVRHWRSPHPDWDEAPYDEREARRIGLPVSTPPADTRHDWMDPLGSGVLARLRAGEGHGHFDGSGAWPFRISGYAWREDNDHVLWQPSANTIVSGGTLSDLGRARS